MGNKQSKLPMPPPLDDTALSMAIAVVRSEGAEAQVRGISRRANPCLPGSAFWSAWAEGWDVSATISRRLAEPLFLLVPRQADGATRPEK